MTQRRGARVTRCVTSAPADAHLRNAYLRNAGLRNNLRRMAATNPFRFGALALDEAFTDRDREIKELVGDVLNGQDVVIFAPRRYGKSSLVWRVRQRLARRRALVAHVDLMTTPTKARLAEKLAKTIHEDVASPLFRARERLRVSRACASRPTVTVDPERRLGRLQLQAAHAPEDLDATIERLLELPARARRGARPHGCAGARRVPGDRGHRPGAAAADARGVPGAARGRARLPGQPAPHDGAHLQRRERAVLAQREADGAGRDRAAPLRRTRRAGSPTPSARSSLRPSTRSSAQTGGHPYATQELCYFLWQATPAGGTATRATSTRRSRRCCAPSTPTSPCCGRRPQPSGWSCRRSPRAGRAARGRLPGAARAARRIQRAARTRLLSSARRSSSEGARCADRRALPR